MQLIKNASEEKLRGGFYTPNPIAAFILKWAFNGNKEQDILEPSCGNGVFLVEIQKGNYQYNAVTAIEFDEIEAEKSRNIGLANSQVIHSDFHDFCINTKQRFDLIVGNPPYIRYQYFNKEQQQFASDIFGKADLKYSKLTNAWVSFVVGSSPTFKRKWENWFCTSCRNITGFLCSNTPRVFGTLLQQNKLFLLKNWFFLTFNKKWFYCFAKRTILKHT